MIITIELPDENFGDLVAAFSTAYGYQETVGESDGQPIPNSVTRTDFAQEQLFNMIREQIVRFKLAEARELIPAALRAVPIKTIFTP